MAEYSFVNNTFMVPYTKEVADYCDLFACGDDDLDEFFSKNVFLYEEELLGKTYCWINRDKQREIVAIATLSYDGIKTYTLDNPSRNSLDPSAETPSQLSGGFDREIRCQQIVSRTRTEYRHSTDGCS